MLRSMRLLVDAARIYIKLEKNPSPDASKERAKQDRELHALMSKAYDVPFYRERFDRVGLVPADFRTANDLRRFPLLTKQEFHDWMASIKDDPRYEQWYVDHTSGSSGRPTAILYSPYEKAYSIANWLRVLKKAGANFITQKTMSRRDKNDSTRDDGLLQKIGLMRRRFLAQYEDEDAVIRAINEYQPDLLYMNKTEFIRIALFAEKNNLSVWHPNVYFPVGEMIDASSRRLLTSVFGPNLGDSFGTAETGACMLKTPGARYHRVHADSFVVDLCKQEEADSSASEWGGVSTGLLVVTPLYKTDIPVINYVVSDYATAETIEGVRVFTKIEGRSTEFILHEDGSKTTFFMVDGVIAHCEGAVQIQFVQKSYTHLVVRVVYDQNADKTRDDIEKYLEEALPKALRHPMNISIEWVDFLPAGVNGKLQLIVNEMDITE